MATLADGEDRTAGFGQRLARALATDFLVATLGGSFLLLLKGLAVVPPIVPVVGLPLILILYLTHGYATGKDQQATTRERFGDNLYFLGFIFTMGSLIASFLPVAFGRTELALSDIYPAFGTALIATALGLVLRVVVIQTGANDGAEASPTEVLPALARDVAAQAQAMLAELQQGRKGLAEQNRKMIEDVLGRIDGKLREIATQFGAASASARSALATQAEDLRTAAEALRLKLAANTEDLTRAADSLASARTRMSTSLDSLAGPVADLSRDLAHVGESSQQAAQSLRDTVARLKSVLDDVAASGEQLSTRLWDLETTTGKTGTDLREALAGLGAHLTEGKSEARKLAEDARAFEASMTGAIRTFGAAVDRLAATLEAVPHSSQSGPEAPAAGSNRGNAGAPPAAATGGEGSAAEGGAEPAPEPPAPEPPAPGSEPPRPA